MYKPQPDNKFELFGLGPAPASTRSPALPAIGPLQGPTAGQDQTTPPLPTVQAAESTVPAAQEGPAGQLPNTTPSPSATNVQVTAVVLCLPAPAEAVSDEAGPVTPNSAVQ